MVSNTTSGKSDDVSVSSGSTARNVADAVADRLNFGESAASNDAASMVAERSRRIGSVYSVDSIVGIDPSNVYLISRSLDGAVICTTVSPKNSLLAVSIVGGGATGKSFCCPAWERERPLRRMIRSTVAHQ